MNTALESIEATSEMRVGLIRGTPVALAGRNQRDADVLALLLD
jgi:hypothetical protein